MNPGARAVLVPPRPNLGPEPMTPRPSTLGLILILLLVAAGTLGLLGLVHDLRRLRRREPSRAERLGMPTGPFDSRREQMAACSAAVRAALAARFGARWHARTTEEIANDATLAETLGPEHSAQLIQFLSMADRAKFDDREGLQSPLPDAAPEWLAGFVASPLPAAGASSRITGK
jgi:hypothetical protein